MKIVNFLLKPAGNRDLIVGSFSTRETALKSNLQRHIKAFYLVNQMKNTINETK